MKRRSLQSLLLVGSLGLGALLWTPRVLLAQAVSASPIKGTVTDTTGAVVPGAKVTATNTDTNISRETTTAGDGGYVIPNLVVGNYRITVEKEGFKTEIRDNVKVVVGVATVIDVQMSVGAVTQTVTVSATAVPITEDKPDRGVNFSVNTLQELPVQVAGGMRQPESFLILAPGVTGDTFAARINGARTSRTTSFLTASRI